MNSVGAKKVLLCYIDGFDIRSVNASNTPFISDALKTYPYVQISSPPSADSVPTLLTGTYPHEHGMWGVRLDTDIAISSLDKIADRLPDFFTTMVQCIAHMFNETTDLPTIPPRRRRYFKAFRTQHNTKYHNAANLLNIGGRCTCFGVIGENNSSYLFSKTSKPTDDLLSNVASGKYLLEILQYYSIDLIQRWNIDNPRKINVLFRKVDDFIKALYHKCLDNSITLILFSDHGYDRVIQTINIIDKLHRLKLPKSEYSYFIELSMIRFWFNTQNARSKIMLMLKSIDHTTILTSNDLEQYNIKFSDTGFGEVFLLTHPGYVFFPHDFHHPLVNFCIGLADNKQCPRILNPVHRGDHCLLPVFDSSKGYLMLLDDSYKTKMNEANLTDVAPTLLDILNYKKPYTMKGSSIFGTRYENIL